MPAWKPEGELSETSFAWLLMALFAQRKTGRLYLSQQGIEKEIDFENGLIVFAKSRDANDRLGELMLRRGAVTYRNLVAALGRTRAGVRLGAALVEDGAIRPDQLVWAVKEQIREIVLSVFPWRFGAFRWKDGLDESDRELITLSLPMELLVKQGIARLDHWGDVLEGAEPLDEPIQLVPERASAIPAMQPSEAEKVILDLAGTKITTWEILDKSPLGDFDTLKFLWAAKVMRIVRVESEPLLADGEEDPFAALFASLDSLESPGGGGGEWVPEDAPSQEAAPEPAPEPGPQPEEPPVEPTETQPEEEATAAPEVDLEPEAPPAEEMETAAMAVDLDDTPDAGPSEPDAARTSAALVDEPGPAVEAREEDLSPAGEPEAAAGMETETEPAGMESAPASQDLSSIGFEAFEDMEMESPLETGDGGAGEAFPTAAADLDPADLAAVEDFIARFNVLHKYLAGFLQVELGADRTQPLILKAMGQVGRRNSALFFKVVASPEGTLSDGVLARNIQKNKIKQAPTLLLGLIREEVRLAGEALPAERAALLTKGLSDVRARTGGV